MKKISALGWGIFALTAPVFASGSWFEPTRVPSNPTSGISAPFNLKLMNNKYDCADRFTNISATVSANQITLTYTEGRDTGIVICPLLLTDYGPTFRIPGLRNGYYEVFWQFYSRPCQPLDPLCELTAPPVYAGLLAVAGDISWSMQPKVVDANTPFSLNLLNEAYGNCYTAFANLNSNVTRSGPIDLSFSIEYYPARMCLVDLHPSGPDFQMQGLPAGSYPIYAMEQPACMHDSNPCYPQVQSSVVVDTLVVRVASALRPAGKIQSRALGAFPVGIFQGHRVNGRKGSTVGNIQR